MANIIREDLDKNFEKPDSTLILFTAHSLPYKCVTEGDPYSTEIATTANYIMDKLGRKNTFRVCW